MAPVSRFVMEICAPGNGAPDAPVTEPVIDPPEAWARSTRGPTRFNRRLNKIHRRAPTRKDPDVGKGRQPILRGPKQRFEGNAPETVRPILNFAASCPQYFLTWNTHP